MKIKWLDHTNKIIGLADVTDEEHKLLNFFEYVYCNTIKDENGMDIEIYKPISLIHSDKIGKWVAFKQDGMPQILHGKVFDVHKNCMKIKCKNGNIKYADLSDCYEFFDDKKECYEYKEH